MKHSLRFRQCSMDQIEVFDFRNYLLGTITYKVKHGWVWCQNSAYDPSYEFLQLVVNKMRSLKR